ncbi:uncharacterized protein perm1b [Brachionichthys hirsutus]|uniref:uncharacterized protein perm1b n=1 Tax=Brachionichthys hirsutus TaxID=412623 RepID=UPI00360546FF
METDFPSTECFEYQNSDVLISNTIACPRRIRKCESTWSVQALNTDLSLLGSREKGLSFNSFPSENVPSKRTDSWGTLMAAHFLSSKCFTILQPDNLSVSPAFDYTRCAFSGETSFTFLRDSQCKKPIPIFSCSHPTVRELTLCNQDYVLRAEEEDGISANQVGSRCFTQGGDYGDSVASLQGLCTLKGFLSRRKICFHDKGSIWCRGSGAWEFPVEAENNGADQSNGVATEGKGSSSPPQLYQEVAAIHSILETIQTARQDSFFSTLTQSDMCLVCIAFSSWVLSSSDPDAADAWKAVLLANVSALSAIQYLRQYVKKTPPQEESFSR